MWQPVLMINGFLVIIIGLAMLLPAIYDVVFTNVIWSPFLTAALISLFLGLAMFLGNRMLLVGSAFLFLLLFLFFFMGFVLLLRMLFLKLFPV